MIHQSHVKKRLRAFALESKRPPVLFVLRELYGVPMTDIALALKKSPSQITNYYAGRSPIPPEHLDTLRQMLKEAVELSSRTEHPEEPAQALVDGLTAFSQMILDSFRELHT